ncbi:MAG TPA: DEAD/DEAH box helicase family protein [Anaerolineales bacterium]|nr:DEAD/DEAH box helicase family protein [Anaerolineales bacterium]
MPLTELDIPFALNTSKNNLIEQFFVPLLKNSVRYDRGVGFFSSRWVKESFIGMSDFAKNGGKARWITSPILGKEDWDAILLGDEAKHDEILKQSLLNEIQDLSQTLQQNTLVALAWMIADGIIEFKLAKPRNKLNHEFHAKVGIFTDRDGNRISFDGSYNDSLTGLYNYESIKVFRSWDTTKGYVEQEESLFESIWNDQDPNIEVYEIPDAVTAQILKLRENTERPYPMPEWVKLKSVIENASETKIPYPHIPTSVILRDYQSEAIDNWFNNGNKGILEMATGTGKTITALSAAVKLLDQQKNLITVIICPYIHLAQQWIQEAEKFGYRPILVAESKSKWLEKVQKLVRDFKSDRIAEGSVVTTNDSFLSDDLQEILSPVWNKILLIADEMHHCGSPEFLKKLPYNTSYRLGLSATPIRDYDELGTEQLLDFFGNIAFRFDLKDAIEHGFLTPYYYYPIPVHMQDDEFDEFINLTKKLNRLHPNPKEPISDWALKLAIKRARVLNNSRSKIDWINQNIEASSEMEYTLFYVGDQIFDEVRVLLGYEKRIPIHEFTHRQSLSERKNLLTQFQERKIKAFVAMKCLDEGVDIPPTRTAYFLASSSVEREFVQRRGRVLRRSPGKTHANIYDLISIPPYEYITKGKSDENYNAVRSALRREFTRIKEFASLAENQHRALNHFVETADKFDLLSL